MGKRSFIRVCDRDINVQGRLIRIARPEADEFVFIENPEMVINSLRESETRADLFTFVQRLSECSPKYAYPLEWDNFAAMSVSTFDHWLAHQAHDSVRTKVRKAEKKGLEVREVPFDDVLVRGIWEIYNECPVRQGRPFHHYGKDLETVRKMTATFLDRSIFIGTYFGGSLIGFVKLVIDPTGELASTMHVISQIRHRDKAPTNALIAQLVRSCADRGISRLVYGKFAYGSKRGDSLSDFKEYSGFRRIDVPRYYVPLTLIGRLALGMGLHHCLVDYCPEPVVAKFRELRSGWYNRKIRSVAHSS